MAPADFGTIDTVEHQVDTPFCISRLGAGSPAKFRPLSSFRVNRVRDFSALTNHSIAYDDAALPLLAVAAAAAAVEPKMRPKACCDCCK